MHQAAADWFGEHTYRSAQWDAEGLASALAERGLRVSVVIPARNEAGTVGGVVEQIRAALMDAVGLVDELVVIDSDSTDETAKVAAAAGATVHASREIRPDLGSHPGKGEALWKSLFVTRGELLVFIDADLTLWGPHFVTGLLGPFVERPETALVKGFYDRILHRGDEPPTPEGGRVTELVARPILNLWWPHLAAVVQPLAGEWAIRRSLFETLQVPTGYGVEIAAVIDTATRLGLGAIAQTDLGARAHQHQKDHDLAVMAAELMAVSLRRCGGSDAVVSSCDSEALEATLHQFHRTAGESAVGRWQARPIPVSERPAARDCIVQQAGSAC